MTPNANDDDDDGDEDEVVEGYHDDRLRKYRSWTMRALLLLLIAVVFIHNALAFASPRGRCFRQAATILMSTTTQQGIKVMRGEEALRQVEKQDIRSWPTWGCQPSTFPWTYTESETCYLLEGDVTVTPDDESLSSVTFGAGDLVTFPCGMSCTWEVRKAVNKHYKFY